MGDSRPNLYFAVFHHQEKRSRRILLSDGRWPHQCTAGRAFHFPVNPLGMTGHRCQSVQIQQQHFARQASRAPSRLPDHIPAGGSKPLIQTVINAVTVTRAPEVRTGKENPHRTPPPDTLSHKPLSVQPHMGQKRPWSGIVRTTFVIRPIPRSPSLLRSTAIEFTATRNGVPCSLCCSWFCPPGRAFRRQPNQSPATINRPLPCTRRYRQTHRNNSMSLPQESSGLRTAAMTCQEAMQMPPMDQNTP